MKAIYTLALVAAGAVLINSTPLRAAEADGRIKLSFNKSQPYPPRLSDDAIKIGEKPRAQVQERAGVRLEDEVGDLLSLQVRPEVGAPAVGSYSPMIQLRDPKPNNVIQSEKHPGIEYSGILVQSVRSSPLQLINPFAPARYGDGEANTVRNVITGQAEGMKVLGIRFL
jgi:hypothetical protein